MSYKIYSSKYFGVEPFEVNPDFIDFDKTMQEGYMHFQSDEWKEAARVWEADLKFIKKYFKSNDVGDMRSFDDIYKGNQYASNWVLDYDEALRMVLMKENDEEKAKCGKMRIELLKFIQMTDSGSEHNQLESLRSIAETYYYLGEPEKGEELFKELIEENPDFTWGYIGYSDQYWLEGDEYKDYEKAFNILQWVYLRKNAGDIDVVMERMADLYIRIEKDRLERYLAVNSMHKTPGESNPAKVFERVRKTVDVLPLADLEYIGSIREEFLSIVLDEMDKYSMDPVSYARENEFFSLYIPMLLGQWEIKEASRYIIDVAACSEDVIDSTIGDMLTEAYPVILYKCFDGDTQYLKDKIRGGGIDGFSKLAYLQVLSLYYIQDEKNIDEFKDYLSLLLEENPEMAAFVPDVIMIHHKEELLPMAEKCIASGFYNEDFCGNRDEYMKYFMTPDYEELHKFMNPFDAMEELKRWKSYISNEPAVPDYDEVYKRLEQERKALFPEIRVSGNSTLAKKEKVVSKKYEYIPKPGRNDKCPCGSGKKYKHCCLKLI